MGFEDREIKAGETSQMYERTAVAKVKIFLPIENPSVM
jgi:hypothetical protein